MDVTTRSRFRGESPSVWVRRLPSWLLSVVVHGLLYVLLMAFIRPLAPRGAGEGEFRTVGITTRAAAAEPTESPEGADQSDSSPATSTTANPETSAAVAPREVVEPPPVDDQPPIPLDIPRRPTTETGSNAPDMASPASTAGVGVRELTRPRGSASTRKSTGVSAGGSGQAGPASVSFFGGGGQPGTRFAFVLDASASMYENNSIQVAKTELQASLLQVEEEQEFQVIFYNEDLHPMPTTGQRSSMFRGTEANRNRAAQHIRSVQPSGGTRHKEALLEALRLKPDVIFFLTDAGEPWMTAADLGDIRKRNSGRCRICVVEFGKGSPLSNTDSYWTKRLARENDGTYSYHDVNQFRRR